MNSTIEKIIDALEKHQDTDSVNVLEELGTNSQDSEIRERTAQALVRKNTHESLRVVLINQGKGINDMNPAVAMSTINEILSLDDKNETIKILNDTINLHSVEEVRENAQSVLSLLELS